MKYFYISTYGGSASTWLTSLLNLHNQLFSVHGTRAIPPMRSGLGDLSVDQFFRQLEQYSNLVKPSASIIGAIHGYYGVSALAEVQKRNGIFVGIIRDPVKRINNLFNHHAKDYYLFASGTDIYQDINANYLDVSFNRYVPSDKKSIKNILRHPRSSFKERLLKSKKFVSLSINGSAIYLTGIEELFYNLVFGVINDDFLIAKDTPFADIYKMEDLVSSKEACLKLVDHLSQGSIDIDDEVYIEAIESQLGNKINQHVKSNNSSVDVYQQWPDSFKFIYQSVLNYFGNQKVEDLYTDKFGYNVPVNLEHNFYIKNGKIVCAIVS